MKFSSKKPKKSNAICRHNALDIINEKNCKGELKQNAPITLFIQQGTEIIDTHGCNRIDDADCVKQAEWSLGRQKFHPETQKTIELFFEKTPYTFDVSKILEQGEKLPIELKIIGLCELVYWSMEVALKKNRYITFYFYQLENGLHPCYETRLAEIVIHFYKYSEKRYAEKKKELGINK
jgi:hypothetical protein